MLKTGDIIYVEKIKKINFRLQQVPKINGGIVVMDPYTGRVLALSGGFSFKNSEFNRASQALRQPGSAFKPFVYALALENRFTPSSLSTRCSFSFRSRIRFKIMETRKLWKKILWSINFKSWFRKI